MKKLLASFLLVLLSTQAYAQGGGFGGFFSPRPQFLVTDGTCVTNVCTNDPAISCAVNEDCAASFIDNNNLISLDKDAANSSLCRDLGANLGVVGDRLFNDKDCDGVQDTGEELLDATLSAGVNVYYVTNDGVAVSGCSYTNPCGLIQDAIDQASLDYQEACEGPSDFWGDQWRVGCQQNFVFVGPGIYTENLQGKEGVSVIGTLGHNSGTEIRTTGTNECGLDLTDTGHFSITDIVISNWGIANKNICTRGGTHNCAIRNVYLTNVSGYGGKGWAISFRGLGNVTNMLRSIETFHIGHEAGAQFWFEIGKPNFNFNANIGRCIRGRQDINSGGCDNNNDCDNGQPYEYGTCYQRSADLIEYHNFLQYEGAVGVLYKEPTYCETGTPSSILGLSCDTNTDCGAGGLCRQGFGTSFNATNLYNSYQGLDSRGGLCDSDDSNPFSPCYKRCIGGSNAGSKCSDLDSCNTGKKCTSMVCNDPGADVGTTCSQNSDCDSNKCTPFACTTDANCSNIGLGTCSATGYSASSSCDQEHSWDCGTAGDAQCLAGGIWVHSTSSDGIDEDALVVVSRNETFGTSDAGVSFQADFDVKTSGSDSSLNVCGSSMRTGYVQEGNSVFAKIFSECYAPVSALLAPKTNTPVVGIDGELYYNKTSNSWCFWEEALTPDGELCLPSSLNILDVPAGGTGLGAIPDESFVYCNVASGSCDTDSEVLSTVTIPSQGVIIRQSGSVTTDSSSSDEILGRKSTANLGFMKIDPRQSDAVSKTTTPGASSKFVIEEGNSYGSVGCAEYTTGGLLSKTGSACNVQPAIQVKDEGTNKGTLGSLSSINFVGPELTATNTDAGSVVVTQKSCWYPSAVIRYTHYSTSTIGLASWNGGAYGGQDVGQAWFHPGSFGTVDAINVGYAPVLNNITISNLKCVTQYDLKDTYTLSVDIMKTAATDCAGEEQNNNMCSASGVPYTCCTGAGTGTCNEETDTDGGIATCWENSTLSSSTDTTLTGTTGYNDRSIDASSYSLDVDAGQHALVRVWANDKSDSLSRHVICSWKVCDR